MAQRPRVGFQQTFQGAPLDQTAGASAEQFAQLLSGFRDISGQVALGEAARKGAQEGAIAGSELQREQVLTTDPETGQPTFEEGKLMAPDLKEGLASMTAYGQAFNKATVQAYTAGIDNDARLKLTALGDEFASDPDGFANAAESYVEGTIADMPPEIQAQIGGSLRQLALRKGADVAQKFKIAEEKRHLAEFSTRAENLLADTLNLTRAGDTEGAAKAQADFKREVEQAFANGIIKNPEQKEKVLRQAEDQFVVQGELSSFEDVLDGEGTIQQQIAGAEAYINDFRKTSVEGIDPQQRDAVVNKMWSMLNRKKSQLSIGRGTAKKAADDALKDYEKAVSLGFDVTDEETARVAKSVAGMPDLEKRFGIAQTLAGFSVLSAEQQREMIAESTSGQLEDVDRFAAMGKAHAQVQKMASEDGYALAQKQGLIEPIPLQFGDPDSVNARIDQASVLSQHYGVPVSPLTNAEADQLTQALPDMTVNEKIGLAQAFADAPKLWEQLDTKNAHVFAMAGATGDENVMRAVFTGEDLIKQRVVQTPKPNDYLIDFNEATEGVYGAQDAASILQSTLSHYAATANQPDGTYDRDAFLASLEQVTGGLGEVNGFRVELPRGVEAADFDDFVSSMMPGTVAELGGVSGMTDERAAELIRSGRIRSIKTGEYVVELDNGALFSAEDPTSPFILRWDENLVIDNQALWATAKRRARRSNRSRGRN